MSMFLLKLGDMRFPLRLGETLLGRSPYCSIVLADTLVSRQHAAIRLSASELVIEDLGSRNGTRVNGAAVVGRQALHSADVIELGGVRLQVELAPQQELARRSALAITGEYGCAAPELDSPTSPGSTLSGNPPSLTPSTKKSPAERV